MTMIGDDAKLAELLAPLTRIEPVAFAGSQPAERRPLLLRPLVLAGIVIGVLALTGFGIVNGIGIFNGFGAAQNGPTVTLPSEILAGIKSSNATLADCSRCAGKMLPNTARVIGELPDGTKVYGLADTRGDLCLVGGLGGCGPPLSDSQPITFGASNESPTTGGTFTAGGVAIDGVTSVSFTPVPGNGANVTVPVTDHTWIYQEHDSHAVDGHCLVAHMADGSTVDPFPEVPCP
jgi:hypothetical protein